MQLRCSWFRIGAWQLLKRDSPVGSILLSPPPYEVIHIHCMLVGYEISIATRLMRRMADFDSRF